MTPFLTLVCRCCDRPKMLTKALRSVLAQSDTDVEIVFIVDPKRRGVRWANRQFGRNVHRVRGKYVYTLDDDTFLPNRRFVERLKTVPENPAVIMVKGRRPQLQPHILPKSSVWGKRDKLRVASTNGACFVVRADYWEKHAHHYGAKGSGDWNFLNALKQDRTADFYWLNFVAKETQQLGRGRRFEQCHPKWFNRICKEFDLVEFAPGDWRLPLFERRQERVEAKPIVKDVEITIEIPMTEFLPPGQRWGETILPSVKRVASPPHSLLGRRSG